MDDGVRSLSRFQVAVLVLSRGQAMKEDESTISSLKAKQTFLIPPTTCKAESLVANVQVLQHFVSCPAWNQSRTRGLVRVKRVDCIDFVLYRVAQDAGVLRSQLKT